MSKVVELVPIELSAEASFPLECYWNCHPLMSHQRSDGILKSSSIFSTNAKMAQVVCPFVADTIIILYLSFCLGEPVLPWEHLLETLKLGFCIFVVLSLHSSKCIFYLGFLLFLMNQNNICRRVRQSTSLKGIQLLSYQDS